MWKYFEFCSAELSVIDEEPSVLGRIYKEERRNDQWAGSLEEKIKEAALGVTGLTVTGECHASLCRYDMKTADPRGILLLMNQFHDKFAPTVKGTTYAVVGIRIHISSQHDRQYFYSALLPAPFVDPFLQEMRKLRPPST
jgi:hypothetical protein